MNRRREFLTRVGAFAALTSFDASELKAAAAPAAGAWDTSWIEALVPPTYRVVFNAEDIADGAALTHAETFLDHFQGLRTGIPLSWDTRLMRPIVLSSYRHHHAAALDPLAGLRAGLNGGPGSRVHGSRFRVRSRSGFQNAERRTERTLHPEP